MAPRSSKREEFASSLLAPVARSAEGRVDRESREGTHLDSEPSAHGDAESRKRKGARAAPSTKRAGPSRSAPVPCAALQEGGKVPPVGHLRETRNAANTLLVPDRSRHHVAMLKRCARPSAFLFAALFLAAQLAPGAFVAFSRPQRVSASGTASPGLDLCSSHRCGCESQRTRLMRCCCFPNGTASSTTSSSETRVSSLPCDDGSSDAVPGGAFKSKDLFGERVEILVAFAPAELERALFDQRRPEERSVPPDVPPPRPLAVS